MQECETGTGKSSFVKRVSVRSGGAGHAHSGVVKSDGSLTSKAAAISQARTNAKLVRLGR